MKQRAMWPIFWSLKPEAQAALMELQWKLYGTRLDTSLEPKKAGTEYPLVVEEDTEEIGRLMRQPPSRSRGKGG